MQGLVQLWAQEFMKTNPGIAIYTDARGTAKGIEALVNKTVNLATASRPLRPAEARRLAEKHGAIGMTHLVAKDALSIYVHPSNSVENLTETQLENIFTGELQNWSMVGGPPKPIHVLIRSPNSGTFLYFQEHVLGGDPYAENARALPTTRSIAAAIAEDEYAIGYGGMGYNTGIKHLHIATIAPTAENVIADRYPITRYLYLVTIDKPNGLTRRFVDWVLSPKGQQIVKQAGYYPIWHVSGDRKAQ